MEITINGKKIKIDRDTTLKDLLKNKKIENEGIIIQLNGEVLNSGDHSHKLNDRDTINIFKIAGGG